MLVLNRSRGTVLATVLAGTALLVVQTLLAPRIQPLHAADPVWEGDAEAEAKDQLHRMLLVEGMDDADDARVLAIPGEDVEGGSVDAIEPLVTPFARLIRAGEALPPYTIRDAVDSSRMYENAFALMVYDPEDDRFHGVFFRRHPWVSACGKLVTSFKYLAFFLRTQFPERFKGTASEELVIPISSSDSPMVKVSCLDQYRRGSNKPTECPHVTAPILHFGSVFRWPFMFPSMVAMPMPDDRHLKCFEIWAQFGKVCPHMTPSSLPGTPSAGGDLVFGEDFGLAWENLIPQVVWRGSDFLYLTKLNHRALRKPVFDENLVKWPWSQSKRDRRDNKIGGELTAVQAVRKQKRLAKVKKRAPGKGARYEQQLKHFSKAAAVKAMNDQYEMLLPRWKAVVLTAEAEVQAEAPATQPEELPWANMKFSRFVKGGRKVPTRGSEEYREWEEVGLATGAYMGLGELARYKYQIDLGGGGGTTWSGTVEKLAMPGLLFHHLTPAKDYIHDRMVPWVHHVPVSSDLRDLRRKYEWAKGHPVEAREIAARGTELMKFLTSPQGHGELFRGSLVEPLRAVIEAYQPMSTLPLTASWQSWREALREIEGDDMIISNVRCAGTFPARHGCDEEYGRTWMNMMMKMLPRNSKARRRKKSV